MPVASDSLAAVMGRIESALGRLPEAELRVVHIAEAAAVSPRTLYRAFAKHRGTTPIASLRRARLEGLRRRLLEGAPADTVTSLALDCGFTHLGRLAAYYQRCFGERPSQTLRRARSCGAGRAA